MCGVGEFDDLSVNLVTQKSLEMSHMRRWPDARSSKSLPALRRNKNWESAYWTLGKLGPDMQDPKLLEKVDALREIS